MSAHIVCSLAPVVTPYRDRRLPLSGGTATMEAEGRMKQHIRLGSVFGISLGIHFSWLLIAFLITLFLTIHFSRTNPDWSTPTVWAAALITGMLFFAGIYLHELSHALVAKARGLPIRRITLFALGGVAQIEAESKDPATEFWMGIAGPITSVVLGAVCLTAATWLGWQPGMEVMAPATPPIAILVWLGYINIVLAVFNMLPGFPLDGGRVLRAILWWAMGSVERATRAASRVGQAVAMGFIGLGLLLFLSGQGFGGLWLALIGWFLLSAASSSYMQVEAAAVMRGLRVRDVMSRDCELISGALSLQDFVESALLRTGRRCFLVVDNGRLTGLITPHEVRQVERSQWPQTSVNAAMKRLADIRAVSPEAPLNDALELMSREDVNQLPVVADGRLEGILSRGHIMQLLQARAELGKAS
jgi:Zn-dependent protease/CBS domain-containing protein